MPPKAVRDIRSPSELNLEFWRYFHVIIKSEGWLIGGIPKNPALIESWLKTKFPGEPDKVVWLAAQTQAELGQKHDETEEKEALEAQQCVGFKRDSEMGLYIEGRQVKACIREAANVLKGKIEINAFRSRVAERAFVMESRLFMGRMEPDGVAEGPIHVTTRMGPRTALKRAEYVNQVTIEFHIAALDEPIVTQDKRGIWPEAYLPVLLNYATIGGLGANRSQDFGRFQILRFAEVKKEEAPPTQLDDYGFLLVDPKAKGPTSKKK